MSIREILLTPIPRIPIPYRKVAPTLAKASIIHRVRPLGTETPILGSRTSLICLGLLVIGGFLPQTSTEINGLGFVIRTSELLWAEAYESTPIGSKFGAEQSIIQFQTGSMLPIRILYIYACFEFMGAALNLRSEKWREDRSVNSIRNILAWVNLGLNPAIVFCLAGSHVFHPSWGGLLLLFPALVLAQGAYLRATSYKRYPYAE